jgi:hypothetical protein
LGLNGLANREQPSDAYRGAAQEGKQTRLVRIPA